MNEAKFTKGPWEVVSYPDSLEASVLAPICGTEATGEIAWIGENNFKTQAEANAYLISAAPEMYDTLEKLVDEFQVVVSSGEYRNGEWFQKRIRRIEKKLSQARGESRTRSYTPKR